MWIHASKVRFALAVLAAAGSFSLAGCMHPSAHNSALTATGGAALFQAKGCPQCHEVNGVGGHKGPDLTHVGHRLSKQQIEQQILEGGNAMPAYKDVVTPVEVKSLVRYLHKLR